MRRTAVICLSTAALALVPATGALAGTSYPPYTQATGRTVSVKALTFTVPNLGPDKDTTCTIDADLYTPSDATPAHPEPAILTTNGFGGSKADQEFIGKGFGAQGYVVLSYSGLGFGADPQTGRSSSGCLIELDDRDWDGAAGKALVDFLGGSRKADDGTQISYVTKDAVSHDGVSRPDDPRVGMVGGSYGGQVQFAVAGIDPRMDALIPIITWNDLSYSLAPNNTSLTGVTYSYPGTEKLDWVTLFFSLGIADGGESLLTDITNGKVPDTSHVGTCPNFDARACQAKAQMDALGYPLQTPTLDLARHASVGSYVKDIKIPTLLAQGENDTLFNLQEAVATYRSLKAQGTPVKMVWQSWGHSQGTPAAGELDMTSALGDSYEGRMFLAWFDHYLKGSSVSTGPEFEFFQPWKYVAGKTGAAAVQAATDAYSSAASYPVAAGTKLFLSGSSSLVSDAAKVTSGSAQLLTSLGTSPTSFSEVSAVNGSLPSQATTPRDTDGFAVRFSTPALDKDLDVVGVPSTDLTIDAPTYPADPVDPALALNLFVKLYDVAPDGTVDLVNRLISPVRVQDPTKVLHVELPGISHRFLKGHTIALVVAGSDSAYRGNNATGPVTVSTTTARPSVVTLPVLGGSAAVKAAVPAPVKKPVVKHRTVKAPVVSAPSRSLAATGTSPLLPLVGVLLAGTALVIRRRRA